MVDKQLVTCCRIWQFQELVPPPKQLLNWHKLSESTILELWKLVKSLQHPGECWMKRGFGNFGVSVAATILHSSALSQAVMGQMACLPGGFAGARVGNKASLPNIRLCVFSALTGKGGANIGAGHCFNPSG